jgi:hypothetical protein
MNDKAIWRLLCDVRDGTKDIEDLAPAIKALGKRLDELMPMPDRKIVCVDFDGVLNSYKSGWAGAGSIVDEPLPGAIAWLSTVLANPALDVRIFSARCNDPEGIKAMKVWLMLHGLSRSDLNNLGFQPGKPKAHLIIDDRAVKFSPMPMGTNYCVLNDAAIEAFQPWYYPLPDWNRK